MSSSDQTTAVPVDSAHEMVLPFILAPCSRPTSPEINVEIQHNLKHHFAQMYVLNEPFPISLGTRGVFPTPLLSTRGPGKGLWVDEQGGPSPWRYKDSRSAEEREGEIRGIPKDLNEFDEWQRAKRRKEEASIVRPSSPVLSNGKGKERETIEESLIDNAKNSAQGGGGGGTQVKFAESLPPSQSRSKLASSGRGSRSSIGAGSSAGKLVTASFTSTKHIDAPLTKSSPRRTPSFRPAIVIPLYQPSEEELRRRRARRSSASISKETIVESKAERGRSATVPQSIKVSIPEVNEIIEERGLAVATPDDDTNSQNAQILFEVGCSRISMDRQTSLMNEITTLGDISDFIPPLSFPEGLQTSTPHIDQSVTLLTSLEQRKIGRVETSVDSDSTNADSNVASQLVPTLSSSQHVYTKANTNSTVKLLVDISIEERLSQEFARVEEGLSPVAEVALSHRMSLRRESTEVSLTLEHDIDEIGAFLVEDVGA